MTARRQSPVTSSLWHAYYSPPINGITANGSYNARQSGSRNNEAWGEMCGLQKALSAHDPHLHRGGCGWRFDRDLRCLQSAPFGLLRYGLVRAKRRGATGITAEHADVKLTPRRRTGGHLTINYKQKYRITYLFNYQTKCSRLHNTY